ncbi:hypothetical protein BH20VER2_BH20VER2_18480 [soil metagenome]
MSCLISICFASQISAQQVTNTDDSGPGSLRHAIETAPSGAIITVALPSTATINLTSGELLIAKRLTILGTGPARLTIQRSSAPGVPPFRIFNIQSSVDIDQLTIANGDSTGGGGIRNQGALRLRHVRVMNNRSPDSGAAIYNTGTLTIENSTIGWNRAGNGAAIHHAGATCRIVSSTVAANENAGASSGNAFIGAAGSQAEFIRSTVAQNSGAGVALWQSVGTGRTSLRSTIVAGNTGGDIGPVGIVDLGFNLLGGDPQLRPLGLYGGLTETCPPQPGSPAIDQGKSDGHSLEREQRGVFRIFDAPNVANASGGDGSDIGAVEIQLGSQLLNLSTRAKVLTGEKVAIVGYITSGTWPSQILVRGLGPSLAQHGISAPLSDPVLERRDSQNVTNDNWRDTQEAAIEATGIPPTMDAEAAVLMQLASGNYTAILRGQNDGTGTGLVELFKLGHNDTSVLANMSTRGFVGTGDEIMIAGFIAGGGTGAPVDVVIRAIGPSLVQNQIEEPLQDPMIELRDRNGVLVAANDDWQTDVNARDLSGFVPHDPRESVLFRTLPLGAHTVLVRGKNGSTGVALVEVFQIGRSPSN